MSDGMLAGISIGINAGLLLAFVARVVSLYVT